MLKSVYTLTIAGLDPCGGAGILADIKTMESHGVMGMTACSALTYQNDIEFKHVEWISLDKIIAQVDVLLERFNIRFIKIGLIESYEVLIQLLSHLRSKLGASCFILWDPILRASAGFHFHEAPTSQVMNQLSTLLDFITPNQEELTKLFPLETTQKAIAFSEQCDILIKGGHLDTTHSNDILISKKTEVVFTAQRLAADKRGTGCVLSSALLCNLALELPMETSISKAKQYVENYLVSTNSKLGVHYA
jgi:hydroxymethylpyrimidine/phosphomethylpyrimidine kinase